MSGRFYARDTASVARALLGHVLESRVGGTVTFGRIVEVEAYLGPHDPAAHGFGNRRTARNTDLFGPPGLAYVYLIYGMHWCFNAVTERAGHPSAVLVRALEPLGGIKTMRRRREAEDLYRLCSGPGKLCQALGITGRVSGTSLVEGQVRVVRNPSRGRISVAAGPRVGITKAAEWPLRFWVEGSEFVSR